jgi:hypothetical protein
VEVSFVRICSTSVNEAAILADHVFDSPWVCSIGQLDQAPQLPADSRLTEEISFETPLIGKMRQAADFVIHECGFQTLPDEKPEHPPFRLVSRVLEGSVQFLASRHEISCDIWV